MAEEKKSTPPENSDSKDPEKKTASEALNQSEKKPVEQPKRRRFELDDGTSRGI